MQNVTNRTVIIIAILTTITRALECLIIWAIYWYIIAGNTLFSQIVAYIFIGFFHWEVNHYIKKGRNNILQRNGQ